MNKKYRKLRLFWGLLVCVLYPIAAGPTLAALPLQVGVYRVGSRYIQIAEQNNRICFVGFSARGATTASVEPDPNYHTFYKVEGYEGAVLVQSDINTLLFGPTHYLEEYPVDRSFSRESTEDLEACLNSVEPFLNRVSGEEDGR
jgi:hypothetical protein